MVASKWKTSENLHLSQYLTFQILLIKDCPCSYENYHGKLESQMFTMITSDVHLSTPWLTEVAYSSEPIKGSIIGHYVTARILMYICSKSPKPESPQSLHQSRAREEKSLQPTNYRSRARLIHPWYSQRMVATVQRPTDLWRSSETNLPKS